MEMAARTKPWLVLSLLLLASNCIQQCVHGQSQVPGIFIFGDSQSDHGNNNNLFTTAKSNYEPYGIDFPRGPTGRFTNGRTTVDFISQNLGFESPIPPYANTSGSDILKGVNYASGAAGIRFESGKQRGVNIDLSRQVLNHRSTYLRIVTSLRGIDKAQEYLRKCLYYINIGSNDYINNYFLPNLYPTSLIFTLDQYADNLIDKLTANIQSLLSVGARKFVVVGIGLIGCTPNAISTRGTNGECVKEYNDAAIMFNAKLKSRVDELNNDIPGSRFAFIDSTKGVIDSSSLGFTVINAPCCPTGENGQCLRNGRPCQNRKEYVFYDGFHTTEAVNNLTALGSLPLILSLFQS